MSVQQIVKRSLNLGSNGSDLNLVKGLLIFKTTVDTITTAGVVTYTVDQLKNGIIRRDPNGAGRSDTLPTATLIVNSVPSKAIGATFKFRIFNTADAAENITLLAGVGVTLADVVVIGQNQVGEFIVRVDAVGTPAVTVYTLGINAN